MTNKNNAVKKLQIQLKGKKSRLIKKQFYYNQSLRNVLRQNKKNLN